MIDHFGELGTFSRSSNHFSVGNRDPEKTIILLFSWKTQIFSSISEMFVVFLSKLHLKLWCYSFHVLFWFTAFRYSEKQQKLAKNSKSSHFLKQNPKCVLTSFSSQVLSKTSKSGDHFGFSFRSSKTIILMNDHFSV